MVGRKTQEQQKRIINRQDETGGARSAPASVDMAENTSLHHARRKGENLTAPQADLVDPDDRNILRGKNQESRKTTAN